MFMEDSASRPPLERVVRPHRLVLYHSGYHGSRF